MNRGGKKRVLRTMKLQQVLSYYSLDFQWLGSMAGELLHEGMREGIVLLSWRFISRKMFIFIMGVLWWPDIWSSKLKGTELADIETYSFLCCPTVALSPSLRQNVRQSDIQQLVWACIKEESHDDKLSTSVPSGSKLKYFFQLMLVLALLFPHESFV